MFFIILFVITLLFFLSTFLRTYILSTPRSEYYSVKDLINFIKYKSWRMLHTGDLICYSGLFGQGKTLNMCHDVVSIYNRYNNKKMYDPFRREWGIQKIVVVTNVNISIPHIKLTSLRQLVDVSSLDPEPGVFYRYIFAIDEMSVLLNSRQFKNNIDAQVLNSILTCRHHSISLFYTAQRFAHVDKLLRDVTQEVIECRKIWRIFKRTTYDAFLLENTPNIMQVMPKRVTGVFMSDKDYNCYDTLAVVESIVKSSESGDRLTEAEIIQLQGNQDVNIGKSKARKLRSK